jgi:NAD(P) transhydrogenase subunit alpha
MEQPILVAISIFTLSIFLGVELISKVPPTLHTPLMSGSNAISGITLVGALVSAGSLDQTTLFTLFGEDYGLNSVLGVLAVIFATINVIGGFLVTDRMLRMFKRK